VDTADDEAAHLERLRTIVEAASRRGVRRLADGELTDLPRLYRFASSVLARLETSGESPRGAGRLRALLFAAHGVLYAGLDRDPRPWGRRLFEFLWQEVPRAVRAEWKLLALTLGVVYGLALVTWAIVRADLSAAYSFLNASVVDGEIAQLLATEEGEAFRGNFTFGLGESPGTTGAIMGNNMRVAVLFFATALVPPLYLLVLGQNGMLLGTYTAVAAHWGQAGAISSILWCHGVIEIQAFVLAGTAGLVLLRAWVAPGPWSRAFALRLEAGRAWRLFAPTFPMLFTSGLIEGWVSPHAPLAVRVGVASLSGALLLAWLLCGGRRASSAPGTAQVEPGGEQRRRRLRG
jgi:uncharacterized membrane protein SpoIIM required for sporulation